MIRTIAIALLFASLVATGHAAEPVEPPGRLFTFSYETEIAPIERGSGPVHVFVPLAVDDDAQRVVSERIDATIPGAIEVEGTYGNRFWHGQLEQSDGQPIRVEVETTVDRQRRQREAPTESAGIVDGERAQFSRFLNANERVVVGHPILEPIQAEVRALAGSDDKARISRAIYDWVVANVEYKKVGSGWGNGDTFWACNERYGNCTDFHALFISLARSEGIPARFEIGFPVPDDREAGNIGGYHCWVELYLPEVGWLPIDASEAFKHPEKRELFYGTQPADRIHFSTGRDLVLGSEHRDGSLNYFVYPHVEVDGKAWRGQIDKRFSYRTP